MSHPTSPRVEFASPPVREVALGFEYEPIVGMGTRELVHLQDAWSEEFVDFNEQMALPGTPLIGMADGAVPGQALRLWASDPHRGQLLHLQADRLFLNWTSTEGGVSYPRYPIMRAELQSKWEEQERRLRQLGLPVPQPAVAEFTYVNQVSSDDDLVWTDALHVATADDVPLPGVAGMVQFHMIRVVESSGGGDSQGEIVVNARQGPQSDPAMLVISTRLLIGVAAEPFSVLDRAHDEGNRMFSALTTPAAHQRWGRRT